LTENVLKRISANSNPNPNSNLKPKAQNFSGKQMMSVFGQVSRYPVLAFDQGVI